MSGKLRKVVVWLATATMLFALAGWMLHHWHAARAPVISVEQFVRKQAWKAYGGVWTHDGDIITDRSDERGAKLATGSGVWRDYQFTADLRLRESSDFAGLLVRGNHLRMGAEAYSGYYAGLRRDIQALVIGRAWDGRLDRTPVPLPGGLVFGAWYRMHVVVAGCAVAVELQPLSREQKVYAAMQDDASHCVAAGEVSLLASNHGGDWRNLHLEPATAEDLDRLVKAAGGFLAPLYPLREQAWARMWDKDFSRKTSAPPLPNSRQYLSRPVALTEINTVRSQVLSPQQVHIRGVVTSSSPIYVQDSTAGIRVELTEPDAVNSGDELELEGEAALDNGEGIFRATGKRLLWDLEPLLPLAVSPTQVSAGLFEGSLVEVTGIVRSHQKDEQGRTVVRLRDPTQSFSALLPPANLGVAPPSLATYTTVRIRGICTASRDPQRDGAFVVLVRQSSDMVEAAPPPWWSGWRLVVLATGVALLLVTSIALYLRAEQAKMQAVMEERVRLAHHIHDTLAQNFAGLSYVMQNVRKRIANGQISQTLLQDITTACELVANAHREASVSIAGLHPGAREQGDVLTMLEHASRLLLKEHGVRLAVERTGTSRCLRPMVADAMFRIGMEAVSNILRHSQAKQVVIRLRHERRHTQLSIEDDGVGMTAASGEKGFGIRGMKRRSAEVGGKLHVRTTQAAGCCVHVTVPYRPYIQRFRHICTWFFAIFAT